MGEALELGSEGGHGGQEREQGRRQENKEREQILSGGAYRREEDELCGERMQVAEVQIFAPAPPMIYSTWGSSALGNSARGDS
jgi:hypothetical protein